MQPTALLPFWDLSYPALSQPLTYCDLQINKVKCRTNKDCNFEESFARRFMEFIVMKNTLVDITYLRIGRYCMENES